MAFITVGKENKPAPKEPKKPEITIKLYSNGNGYINQRALKAFDLGTEEEFMVNFQIDQKNRIVRFKQDDKGLTRVKRGYFSVGPAIGSILLEWYKAEAVPSPRKTDENIVAAVLEIKKRSDGYIYLTKPKETVTCQS